MSEWKKTFCPLCYHNCGLEVQTAGHQITKVRPDKNHPRTRGYVCRKGLKVAHYQDHKDRLTAPLKRSGDQFIEISWEQAISEIADKLRDIIDRHGPRALAYMGGGGQGCHMEAGFGRNLLTALGSQYHYSSLAQELSGSYWVNGRAYGRQSIHLGPDLDRAKNFLVIGWNGYVSNAGVNRARKRIDAFAKDPEKQLIVVDPLLSETAKRADKHLQLRIGTVALFLKSLIAIIIQEGWENRNFIADHCKDFDRIVPWFRTFDVAAALHVCALDYGEVKDVAGIYATQPTAMRTDLGILMDRQSTMNSYLEMILMAICGRICTPGGNVIPGHLMPLGPHTDERNEKIWRTMETGIPAVLGYFPPNVAPEEIESKSADRLRAMIVSGSNPLRSYADTLAYEKSFKELELLVTLEITMSETARLSHYVLPAKSAFEKWDATFFNITFPEVFFQVRHPCCKSLGTPLEEGEIFTRLGEGLGILPPIPETLSSAAQGNRQAFAMELLQFINQNKEAAKLLPFVLNRTLGKSLDSAHLAAIWGLLMMYPRHAPKELAAAGYEVNPLLGDTLFEELLAHPEGILIGKLDPQNNLERLRTGDGKIHLHIQELEGWVQEVQAEDERAALENSTFPFILIAGRHFPFTANTIMRDPAWNDHKQTCTALINKVDAHALGLDNAREAMITTEASSAKISLEVSDIPAKGTVIIPHGYGLMYQGKTYGVNVNQLTKNTHRDRLLGTPLHRYIPCRVEKP
ncbi:MAG: molybdopterin-dependent oxidoreductase [Deltaproteobacteria bacterium]|nr:molybdopterin-dependent oxidoreductase [Deltaproteobacteria bacterium]